MPNDQTPPVGTEQEPVTPETTPPADAPAAPAPQPAPAVDYQKKFQQSSSEAQILNAKNKDLEDRLRTLTTQEAPTELELKQRFPEWDGYDSFTKTVLTNQLAQEKRLAKQENEILQMTATQKWEADLKSLTKQPQYAKLRGDEGFEDFVFQPKHRGVDLSVLADAYLQRTGNGETTPPAPSTPPPAPIRDEGLPKGSGGPRTADVPQMSAEEIEAIRTKDPKRYREMLIKGQIV